ncbi:hypothetical protein RCL1_006162 [Eukaryota sp. TZLM3-RCL]
MDHFISSIVRIVVLQLAHVRDVKSIQYSVVEVLSDILQQYIIELGSRAKGETDEDRIVTATDVLMGLSSMSTTALDCLKHLSKYPDIAFAISLPPIPASNSAIMELSHEISADKPAYVPSFFPSPPSGDDSFVNLPNTVVPLASTEDMIKIQQYEKQLASRRRQHKARTGVEAIGEVFGFST